MGMWDKPLEQAHSAARDDRALRVGGANSGYDFVILEDGTLFVVQRDNLVAAKELLAAQKADAPHTASA